MAKSNMTPTARRTMLGTTLQDDAMINTNVLYKGAEINLPSSLRSLEQKGIISLESFVEAADGSAPYRSGLRILPARDETGALDPKTISTLIRNLFPQTSIKEAVEMARTAVAIEITNTGALNILCRTGQQPLSIEGMDAILADKNPVPAQPPVETVRNKGRFSNHEGGFSRSGNSTGFSAQVHGRGGESSGIPSGRG